MNETEEPQLKSGQQNQKLEAEEQMSFSGLDISKPLHSGVTKARDIDPLQITLSIRFTASSPTNWKLQLM